MSWLRWIAVATILGMALPAEAADRYALVIGANEGDPREELLRYAESDAHRIADVLRSAGDFAPQNVTVLTDVTASQVRRALIELNARIRQRSGEVLLVVFFSGHADGASLHLGGTRLAFDEFRELVAGSSATTRVLVIDACRSGVMARVKGGRPGPTFAVPPPLPIGARGIAILASSSPFEDAQESDELRSSFFTHYLVSALRGAADSNRDGRVTLSEAYAFTSERTLAATSVSVVGPQHPTYRFELGGRDDLILTRVGTGHRRLGVLDFADPGEYFVRRDGESGAPVAEVVVAAGSSRRVALPGGRYHITRRGADRLQQGQVSVSAGAVSQVDTGALKEVVYARVVRKGGTAESSAVSTYLLGGVRGSIVELGIGLQASLGVRLDLSQVSIEGRIYGGRTTTDGERLGIDTRELGLSAVGLRAFDLRHLTLAAGLEVGGIWLAQSFGDQRTDGRNSLGLFLGPVGALEIPFGRWYGRAEVAAITYALRSGIDDSMAETKTPLTYRAGLGFGAYF